MAGVWLDCEGGKKQKQRTGACLRLCMSSHTTFQMVFVLSALELHLKLFG